MPTVRQRYGRTDRRTDDLRQQYCALHYVHRAVKPRFVTFYLSALEILLLTYLLKSLSSHPRALYYTRTTSYLLLPRSQTWVPPAWSLARWHGTFHQWRAARVQRQPSQVAVSQRPINSRDARRWTSASDRPTNRLSHVDTKKPHQTYLTETLLYYYSPDVSTQHRSATT